MAFDSSYRTAVVTGASSGIGRAVTRALTASGLTVHGIARSEPALRALAEETGCTAHVLDVNDTAALEALLQGLEVDVLVNNAGLGRGYEGLALASADDVDRVLSTNVAAVVHATRVVLDGMIARRRGHLVNIGSTAGLHPLGLALYGASKGAIHLLCQNLRLELRGTGVRVTEICPGRVLTAFFDTACDDPDEARAMREALTCLEPEDVADAVRFAVAAPWRCNVATIELQPTEQTIGGTHSDPVDRT